MNSSALLSALSVWLTIFVILAMAVVIYALRSKGDVRAEFSHGTTRFSLEAKDRPKRNNIRSVKDRSSQ